MSIRFNYILFTILIVLAILPQITHAQSKTDGAGLVLFTAIQRSKVKQPTGLTFGCPTTTGKHDIYSFYFYPKFPNKPVGLVKVDEKGMRCDPVEWSTFIHRHSTACLDHQIHWANNIIHNFMENVNPESAVRIHMQVTSQINETYWRSEHLGDYLIALFSFVSESKANEIECDFKIQLNIQEQGEQNIYMTTDSIKYLFNNTEAKEAD